MRFSLWMCVSRNNVRGKQINPSIAVRTIALHDPKVIQDFADAALRISPAVKVANAMLDARSDFVVSSKNAATIERAECSLGRTDCDWIDVPT
ncbi:MAG: hypothetical protein SGJ20_22025 [Planctomycetota bacterium]|nr:hypothetical protein [Planctomycetota bacterium]